MSIINVILSAIISAIFTIFSVNNIVKQKINFKMFIKVMLIMSTFGIVICLYFVGISRIILNILLVMFSLYVSLFDKDISKSLYYSIIYEFLLFIGEIIMSIVLITIFKFDLNNYESFSYSLTLFTICNSLLIFLLTKINFIRKCIIKLYKSLIKNNRDFWYIIIVVFITGLLAAFNGYNFKSNESFYITIAVFIFVVISFIYVIYNKIKTQNYENKYNESMEYVQKYEKIINEQGKKNHEYNNQLMVIKGYINNPKKLKEYLDLIVEEHKCGQNYTIRQLSYFPDGGIKGLIYHKIGKMDDNGIKYYLYIDKDIKNIFEEKFDIKTYQDITKLLGVFLDNAIEATIETDPKEIEIEIKREDNTIIINIINTFNDKMNMKQIGKKGFTTKGIGHGYGLSIVKDIAKHNNKIDTLKDIENNKFKQTIIIYYDNKK